MKQKLLLYENIALKQRVRELEINLRYRHSYGLWERTKSNFYHRLNILIQILKSWKDRKKKTR